LEGKDDFTPCLPVAIQFLMSPAALLPLILSHDGLDGAAEERQTVLE